MAPEPTQGDRVWRAVLGTFDGVHAGHRALFARARALRAADGLPVLAVVIDRGGARLTTPGEREQLLTQAGADATAVFSLDAIRDLAGARFIELLRDEYGVCACVCGYDFTFGARRSGNADALRALIDTEVVDAVVIDGAPVSSTRVRSLLSQGKAADAARLLGRPFRICGTVVHGRALGRTLGFPTANIPLGAELVEPAHGVYAARVACGGAVYPAVTNIGTRPTVSGEGVSVESWLLGFDGDLYGQNITVDLIGFLRPEQKFPDVGALRAAVHADADAARRVLGE